MANTCQQLAAEIVPFYLENVITNFKYPDLIFLKGNDSFSLEQFVIMHTSQHKKKKLITETAMK